MNIEDVYAGENHWGVSEDPETHLPHFTNEFILIPSQLLKRAIPTIANPAPDWNPQPYTEPAPVIITSYQIAQRPGGTGIVLLFFDATTIPVDGTAVDGAPGLRFIAPLVPLVATAPGFFLYNPTPAGHRYDFAMAVVVSTSATDITRASEDTLFSVKYMSYTAG